MAWFLPKRPAARVESGAEDAHHARQEKRVDMRSRGCLSPRGFTLIELLMVILILVTLSVALIPSVSQLIARQDMGVVEDELTDAIDYAHTQAISNGRVYTVTVLPADQSMNGRVEIREGQDGEGCAAVAAGTNVIRRILLVPPTMKVSDVPSQGPVVPQIIQTAVRISSLEPTAFNDGRAMCFKSDGSMRDPVLNLPVANPDADAAEAGDVLIRFQQYSGTSPVGVENMLVVSYNGRARARY
jgi:prepilin-type N-terminal cleavage/methylation domain-containing protein